MLRETRTPLKPSSGQSPSTDTRETHKTTQNKKNKKAEVAKTQEQPAREKPRQSLNANVGEWGETSQRRRDFSTPTPVRLSAK